VAHREEDLDDHELAENRRDVHRAVALTLVALVAVILASVLIVLGNVRP
jgi:hypothetical protein